VAASDNQLETMTSAVNLYQAADNPTRKLIDTELAAVRWRRKHGVWLEWAGLACGFIVALVFGYWAFDLIRTGSTSQQVVGGLLGAGELAAVVTIFINGRRS
jgi:NADH:ubiquinone oxidoreductase subunit B-like Fe-S oxidoreductase